MSAEIRPGPSPPIGSRLALGPAGPFPDAPLRDVLERRWLHYAFLTPGAELGLVANVATLGPGRDAPEGRPRRMSILLVHHEEEGWRSSQFNCITEAPLWSGFRDGRSVGRPGSFRLRAVSGSVGVDLALTRTGRPCTSQCAPFGGDHHLRWQSETGVVAHGDWWTGEVHRRHVSAVGYHERVRGRWGWPELGGWVFGFTNQTEGDPDPGVPPERSLVFTLIQPITAKDATGSVMLWRRGRMIRHFPRRCLSIACRDELARDRVRQVPPLADLLGVPPMHPVPRRLAITARMGNDRLLFDFEAASAARVVIPSETSLRPFSVHEVIGRCRTEGVVSGRSFAFESHGIVEFAGGARGD